MEFLAKNWDIVLFILCAATVCGAAVYRFCRMPSDEQIEAVKEWLLGAVTRAERELGGGTGRLKLRYVYDLFVTRFPWLAKLITFNTFSGLVDEVLVEMHEMLEKNEAVKIYVEGEAALEERKVGF